MTGTADAGGKEIEEAHDELGRVNDGRLRFSMDKIEVGERSNMDLFNEMTARILDYLYEAFPVGVDLTTEEFVKPPDHKSITFFCYTMAFLSRENIFSVEDAGDPDLFSGVVLTSKGLAVLNAMPEVLGEGEKKEESYRQKMSAALKSGSKEALKATINQFVIALATGRIHIPL